jgi:predicted transcriptional regulator
MNKPFTAEDIARLRKKPKYARRRSAQLIIDMQKTIRDQWLTKNQLAEQCGLHMTTTKQLLYMLVNNGMAVGREATRAEHNKAGVRPKVYTLCRIWGGTAE